MSGDPKRNLRRALQGLEDDDVMLTDCRVEFSRNFSEWPSITIEFRAGFIITDPERAAAFYRRMFLGEPEDLTTA